MADLKRQLADARAKTVSATDAAAQRDVGSSATAKSAAALHAKTSAAAEGSKAADASAAAVKEAVEAVRAKMEAQRMAESSKLQAQGLYLLEQQKQRSAAELESALAAQKAELLRKAEERLAQSKARAAAELATALERVGERAEAEKQQTQQTGGDVDMEALRRQHEQRLAECMERCRAEVETAKSKYQTLLAAMQGQSDAAHAAAVEAQRRVAELEAFVQSGHFSPAESDDDDLDADDVDGPPGDVGATERANVDGTGAPPTVQKLLAKPHKSAKSELATPLLQSALPLGNAAAIRAWLASLGLEPLAQPLIAAGYDSLSRLATLSDGEGLRQLNLTGPPAEKLMRAVSEVVSDPEECRKRLARWWTPGYRTSRARSELAGAVLLAPASPSQGTAVPACAWASGGSSSSTT